MDFGMVWRKRALGVAAVVSAATLPVLGLAGAASAHTLVTSHGTADAGQPGGSGIQGPVRAVSYRGYVFRVPRSWPVVNLSAHPDACVRFDHHAVYLGQPGASQACPASAMGATEALLISPASAASPVRSVAIPVAHQVVVTAPRIKVTATYQSDLPEVVHILTAAGLPSPAAESPAAFANSQPVPGQALPLSATNDTGLGFDACTAPSSQVMQAWQAHSHLQAIGIYIGGSDRACAQPNLTAAWVSQEAAAGWHFIPLYVGPQLAFGEVTAVTAVTQAVAAAQDAAVQATLLGFGPGTPIYYDMESYKPSESPTALTFLSAWSAELHALNYHAAVYSSSDSGVTDLAANYTSTAYTMPDVIFDALWNGVANTTDPNIPVTDWADNQRVHQYAGARNVRHGGYTLNIDKDYLDVQLSASTSTGGGGTQRAVPTRQASQATEVAGGGVAAFYTGTDGALWESRYSPGAGWAAALNLGGSPTSQPSVVTASQGKMVLFYRGSGDALWTMRSRSSGAWATAHELPMGTLGSAPAAVSTQDGAIDVFWRGQDQSQLWAAESTSAGWSGPSLVASNLASGPSPEVSGTSQVGVFWQGTDGTLWQASHRPGQAWSAPAVLNVGRLGTGPQATGQKDGQVQVFWGGTDRGSIWHTVASASGTWARQTIVAVGSRSEPVALSSSASAVVWKGHGAKLWYIARGNGSRFGNGVAAPLGRVGVGLFAAGRSDGVIDVFWCDPADGHLMHARYSPAGSAWSGPDDLGGSVG